jgi:CubicO group peptidase (beta-lactamase class C family)
MAVGYRYMAGDYQPLTRWIQGFPAGAAWSTADDMAKFMIAHLQDGQYKDTRILQASTAQEMHRRHYTQDPRGSGMAYGFMEIPINGQITIGHGGGRTVYFTGFVLLPKHNVGLFVSYNGNHGEDAPETFTRPSWITTIPVPRLRFHSRSQSLRTEPSDLLVSIEIAAITKTHLRSLSKLPTIFQ